MVYHGAVFNHGCPCSPIAADDRLTVIDNHHVLSRPWLDKNDEGLTMVNHGEQKFYKV